VGRTQGQGGRRIDLPVVAVAALIGGSLPGQSPGASRAAETRAVVEQVGAARLRVVADEADAALAVIRAPTPEAADQAWQRVRASEGYWALRVREAAFHRSVTDSAFRAFLRSDSTARRAPALEATLTRWRHADIRESVRRAAAYLPPGTAFHATLYFEVKPRLNTFVFKTDSGPSIFVADDPSIGAASFENEIAHELHHIGYEAACPGLDTSQATPLASVTTWMGAFGEGWAMLAAAGGPDVYPHAGDDSSARATWDRNYGNVAADLAQLDRFFTDILDRRVTNRDTVTARAMSFFGTVQGPWYTVGYLMTRTVEKAHGHAALMATLCHPTQLVLRYQRTARAQDAAGGHLPLWSDALIQHLRRATAKR